MSLFHPQDEREEDFNESFIEQKPKGQEKVSEKLTASFANEYIAIMGEGSTREHLRIDIESQAGVDMKTPRVDYFYIEKKKRK